MNYISLIIFIVFSSFTSSFSIEAPSISSVEQISETQIKIKWSTNSNYEITRYRLFFTDNSGPGFKEWPNQMERSDDELEGTPLSQSKVNSTFECYLECIQNVQCQFAEFRNIDLFSNNCLLKSNVENKQIESDDLDGREFYQLKKYKSNEVIVKDLPPNNRYTFYVSIYDEISGEWSPKSQPSKPIDIKIEVSLTYSFSDDGMVTINWTQSGKFKEYKMSRYNLKVWINQDETPKDFPIKDEIRKYDASHDYYNLQYTSVLTNNIEKSEECFNECVKDNLCIRYVYFHTDKRCYLISKVNLLQSTYKGKNTELEGVASSASTYKVPLKLEPDTPYEFLLEYKTLSGVYGISKKINFTTPKIASKISAKSNDVAKIENQDVILSCLGENLAEADDIEWEKLDSDRILSKQVSKQTESSGRFKQVESDLNLKNLKRSDSGVYICSLKSNPSISAENKLTVYGAPARPTVQSVVIRPNGKTYINWQASHLGGADHLRKIIVTYSADLKDPSLTPNKIEEYWENNAAELDNNEVTLGETIPSNNQVELVLETDYGMSEPGLFVPPKLEEIKQEPTKPVLNKEPVKSNKTTVILVSLIGIIVLIIILFIVYQSCKKKKPTEKREYNKVPQEV